MTKTLTTLIVSAIALSACSNAKTANEVNAAYVPSGKYERMSCRSLRAENREAVARNLGLPSSARPKALARRCTRSRGALAGGGFVECCQHTNCCQHAHTQSCEHIVLVNPGARDAGQPLPRAASTGMFSCDGSSGSCPLWSLT